MWGYRMNAESRRIVTVKETRDEADSVRTLKFVDPLCASAKPGQFVMAWALGVDEVPMSISSTATQGEAAITVEAVGEASQALYEKRLGDELGVMGPFGEGFTRHDGHIVMVAGGMGVVPLAFLLDQMGDPRPRVSFILGARTSGKLLFAPRLESRLSGSEGELIVWTDDGSEGRRGTAVEALEAFLAERRPDFIYTCGPDRMMAKVFSLAEAHGIPVEASLQAYVKCAIGLCGSCGMGPYLVCKDGPVFRESQLREMHELGRFTRDAAGLKVALGRGLPTQTFDSASGTPSPRTPRRNREATTCNPSPSHQRAPQL